MPPFPTGAPPRIQYRPDQRATRNHSIARRIIPLRRIAAVSWLAAAVQVSGALRPAAVQAQWRPQLQLDNDAYNFWIHPAHRPDEEYTNGVRASLLTWTAPWWGKRFAARTPDCATANSARACRLTVVTLGQDIYTPQLDRTPFAVPDWEAERPYFGWLYLEGKGMVAGERLLRTTTATVGVSGTPSLGQAMQSLFHMFNRRYTREANGWETQVGFEPGVMLAHRMDALAIRIGPPRSGLLDLTTAAGASLGTVRTAADIGGTMRIGAHLSHPWQPRPGEQRANWEFYGLVGGRAEYVARDMSLDGTLRNRERHVERVPTVREYQFGAGLRFRQLQLEYRAITRTQEYETGPGHHTYSTMFASLSPR